MALIKNRRRCAISEYKYYGKLSQNTMKNDSVVGECHTECEPNEREAGIECS